ncbi:MAG: hypothetical protein ACE5OS_02250 [Anaerolineae bacterium]
MSYTIHKLTYADGRAYRYHISDEAGNLRYVAERTGMLLPSPTRLVEFFDPDHNPSGRLQPPEVAPWLRGKRYEVFVNKGGEEAEEPYAVIKETWRLVDILLLRLPRYEVQLGEHCYIVRGSRYGEHFYEIFRPCEEEEGIDEERVDEKMEQGEDEQAEAGEGEEEPEPKEMKVGQIQRPTVGPSYTVESDAAPLRQALLVLAALVILIDMELHP